MTGVMVTDDLILSRWPHTHVWNVTLVASATQFDQSRDVFFVLVTFDHVTSYPVTFNDVFNGNLMMWMGNFRILAILSLKHCVNGCHKVRSPSRSRTTFKSRILSKRSRDPARVTWPRLDSRDRITWPYHEAWWQTGGSAPAHHSRWTHLVESRRTIQSPWSSFPFVTRPAATSLSLLQSFSQVPLKGGGGFIYISLWRLFSIFGVCSCLPKSLNCLLVVYAICIIHLLSKIVGTVGMVLFKAKMKLSL